MAKKKNTATSGLEPDVANNKKTEVPAVSTEASVEEVDIVSTEVPAVSTEASVEEVDTVSTEVPAVSTEASVEEVDTVSTEVPAVSTETSVEEVETVSTEVPAVSTEASVEEVEENEEKTDLNFNSVDGSEFKFIVEKFIFKGKRYTAEEAIKDVDVLEALIEAKSFVIKKV